MTFNGLIGGSSGSVGVGGGGGFTTGGSGGSISGPSLAGGGDSIALIALRGSGVCFRGTGGSNLPGYDIKSQDAMSMLRLSLLATSNGTKFTEVYGGPDGCAYFVKVGESDFGDLGGVCLFEGGAGVLRSKVDHVIVTGKDPLPVRYHGGSVNVTGGGFAQSFFPPSSTCPDTSRDGLSSQAWAVFNRSLNSEVTKEQLKDLVRRSNWEQLVGYKITFPPIPRHATMSMKQTTPFTTSFRLSNEFGNQAVTLSLSDAFDDGGIIDVSNIQIYGAQILDIVSGADLLRGDLGTDIRANSSNPESPSGFGEDDYYVLLDHQCGFSGLSRGQDWFLSGSPGSNTATLILRQGRGPDLVSRALGFGSSTLFLRRFDDQIGNVSEALTLARNSTGNPLNFTNFVDSNPLRGRILRGFKGASLGMESYGELISYSVARPSIEINSTGNDALAIASQVASAGVIYTAIILRDSPAKVALNGRNIRIPTPPDEEGQRVEFDTPIDNLEGTVVDISAPFLTDPASFCGNLKALINSDNGNYTTKITVGGGYRILPGAAFAGKAVQTVEFKYTHGSEQTSQVTSGPIYYPVGGFGDSQYVKRSETITRTAKIVSGNNSTGVFGVFVDGLGNYNAINGIMDPLYPGDRVEVRLLNVPVEK